MPGIDFSKRYSDYARFLPATSEMYTRFVVSPKPKRVGPIAQSDLDFFNPSTNLWYLPCALYSAGQAAKSEGAAHRKDMITGRADVKNTTVLGDSGGFQIQQGSIKFKGDVTRERMMRWLEVNCDWSMILDFPTGGINMGTIDAHYDRLKRDGDIYVLECFEFKKDKAGNYERQDGKRIVKKSLGYQPVNVDEFAEQMDLSINDPQTRGFATCMFQTLVNNEYFAHKRQTGATGFLNVVQGRTIEESDQWYEQVKHYSKASEFGANAFEGWSLAGPHKEKFTMTLTRLLGFRRDGLLEDKNWMHILGVGKLQNGCAYTTMQRMIRKHDNPEFTISYDVSSPFTTAAFGNLFMGYTLDRNGWTIQSEKMDGRQFLGTLNDRYKRRFGKDFDGYAGDEMFLDELRKIWDNMIDHPGEFHNEAFEGDLDRLRQNSHFIETEIGKNLRMRDICVNVDKTLTSTWDVVTYAYLMNHNAQVHLEGVFESQDLYDRGDVDRVPVNMIMLKEAIEEILDPTTKDPYTLIKKYEKTLNSLAGDKTNAGVLVGDALDQIPIADNTKAVKTLKEATKIVPPKLTTFDVFA